MGSALVNEHVANKTLTEGMLYYKMVSKEGLSSTVEYDIHGGECGESAILTFVCKPYSILQLNLSTVPNLVSVMRV